MWPSPHAASPSHAWVSTPPRSDSRLPKNSLVPKRGRCIIFDAQTPPQLLRTLIKRRGSFGTHTRRCCKGSRLTSLVVLRPFSSQLPFCVAPALLEGSLCPGEDHRGVQALEICLYLRYVARTPFSTMMEHAQARADSTRTLVYCGVQRWRPCSREFPSTSY